MSRRNCSYYLGSWRRQKCDLTKMPQAMGTDSSSSGVRLVNFDSALLLRMVVCDALDECEIHLADDSSLCLCCDRSRLYWGKDSPLSFQIRSYPKFRGGAGDVSIQLLHDNCVLCSNEISGDIMLLDSSQLDDCVNIAWEATPDSDEAIGGPVDSVPDWLIRVLAV